MRRVVIRRSTSAVTKLQPCSLVQAGGGRGLRFRVCPCATEVNTSPLYSDSCACALCSFGPPKAKVHFPLTNCLQQMWELHAAPAHTHIHTEAYLKPSNEICNVVISFLSFKGGIERREGLGLYYHTPWREGQGHGGRKGLLKEKWGGVWPLYNPCIQGKRTGGGMAGFNRVKLIGIDLRNEVGGDYLKPQEQLWALEPILNWRNRE